MKSRTLRCISAVTLFSAVSIAVRLELGDALFRRLIHLFGGEQRGRLQPDGPNSIDGKGGGDRGYVVRAIYNHEHVRVSESIVECVHLAAKDLAISPTAA